MHEPRKDNARRGNRSNNTIKWVGRADKLLFGLLKRQNRPWQPGKSFVEASPLIQRDEFTVHLGSRRLIQEFFPLNAHFLCVLIVCESVRRSEREREDEWAYAHGVKCVWFVNEWPPIELLPVRGECPN